MQCVAGDATHLLLALAACLLGYGEVGLWIMSEAKKTPETWVVLEGNPYLKWIEVYAGKEYQDAVKAGIGELGFPSWLSQCRHHTTTADDNWDNLTTEILEETALADPPSKKRLEEWRIIWEECTRLEKRFWDMAMDLAV